MPPHSRGTSETEHPGAGTLFVHGQSTSGPSKRSSLTGPRSRSRTPARLRPSSASRSRERKRAKLVKWPPEWQDASQVREEQVEVGPSGADALLERGIGDYAFLPAPEGLLGRGKFSSVYKVTGPDGKLYALKHTPLHPHHPLIAARLLREPTLLAQLPPHPCLVGVEGWIRTEGHFYLIEQYAATHIPLHLHPLPLRPSRAAYILDQLVSVVRDCMHRGRVCHRDLKGENVLVDIKTGDIVVLDLGLATQFSASEPKLTTCCGSPAFHSPEIVNALNHPPGAVTYYGPELDIWCIALTLLALLSSSRFPLGPSHRSRHIMASRVLDRLQELDTAYPPARPAVNWAITAEEHKQEAKEWDRVRRGLRAFLEMDGIKRMEGFRRYTFGEEWKGRLRSWEVERGPERDKEGEAIFRQISFIPSEIKYTLPLALLPVQEIPVAQETTAPRSLSRTSSPARRIPAEMVLANPAHESDRRVLSYLKYLLRANGILYHCIPSSSTPLLQLVVPLPPPPAMPIARPEVEGKPTPWLSALFRRSRSTTPRSSSVPASSRNPPPTTPSTPLVPSAYIRCYAQIEFTHPPRRSKTRANSRTPSGVTPRSSTAGPHARRRSTTSATPRSASLAPAYLSGTALRSGAVSPTTPSGGEGSLAVASLQQALLRITESSPSLGTPGGRWASPNSPRAQTFSVDACATDKRQISINSRLGDSGNTSPIISTPTTPGSATPVPLPPTSKPGAVPNPTSPTSPSGSRPPVKRAMTSPRMPTVATMTAALGMHMGPLPTPGTGSGPGPAAGAYRGLPPVSPSLALSPLPPIYPAPHPLSRQVSPTDSSSSPVIPDRPSKSRPTSVHRPSRPGSRLNSRAPSRAPSAHTAPSIQEGTTESDETSSTTSSSRPSAGAAAGETSGLPRTSRRPPISRTHSTVSSTAYTSPPSSSETPRPVSYVYIRLSDPRALAVLRKALDVPHDHPVPFSPPARETLSPSLARPTDIRRKQAGRPDDEEEERGRPRSREDPPRSMGTGIGLGLSSGSTSTTGETVAAGDGEGDEGGAREEGKLGGVVVMNEEAGALDISSKGDGGGRKGRREVSSGRKVMGLFGLGGPVDVELGGRRRSGGRTSSAPPVST